MNSRGTFDEGAAEIHRGTGRNSRSPTNTSRRQFLATSAAGVAGIGALGSANRASAATSEHTLTIKGYFDRDTYYSFAVGGNLQKSTANNGTVNSDDRINRWGASGRVRAGTDSYTFDGPLYSFKLSGSDQVQVFLNGEPAYVGNRPDYLLVVEGQGTGTAYTFTAEEHVRTSAAYGSESKTNNIGGNTVHSAVRSGVQAYTFDGDLHAFDFDRHGEINVTLNGEPARVGSRPDSFLMIRGTGTNTSYTFSTGGQASAVDAHGATVDPYQVKNTNTVSSVVGAEKDAYTFEGDLLAFDFDRSGGVQVFLDGVPAHVGNRPDHLLEIQADGERCKYLFETEGKIYEIDSIDPGDEYRSTSVVGFVTGSGKDVYGYDGDLSVINASTSSVIVHRDGERIQPDPY